MPLQDIRHLADKQTLKEAMKRCKYVFRLLAFQAEHQAIEEVMHNGAQIEVVLQSPARGCGPVTFGELVIGRKAVRVKFLKHCHDVLVDRTESNVGHQLTGNTQVPLGAVRPLIRPK